MDLERLGWDAGWAEALRRHPAAGAGAVAGRVARADAHHARVLTADGEVVVPAHDAVVGDWVVTDGATWLDPLPRRTLLARQSAGRTSAEQPLAANVDAVVVAEPVAPGPSLRRIERMLTLAWGSGAEPLVLVTKADVDAGAAEVARADVAAVAAGVDVLAVSALTGEGLPGLRARLGADRTFVLLGPSGAGKSTLVNALAGRELLATGDVRGDGRGRHTTSHRELVLVEGLGPMIDTPGLREVGMTADEAGLERAFEDVLGYADGCRFADCSHTVEPGCGVLAAMADGSLDGARVDSYRRLQREIAHQARRADGRARADERRETAARERGMRVVMRAKGREG